jgi:hypothetical protein
MLKPFPQHGGPGFPVSSTSEQAPQLGTPADRLAQSRWSRGGRRRPMDGAIQGLPFLQRQQHGTRDLRHGTAPHGRIKNAPGNHAIERQTPLEALGRFQLAGCEATATFQNFLPDFHPSGITFTDRGTHILRGIPGEWRLFTSDVPEVGVRPS